MNNNEESQNTSVFLDDRVNQLEQEEDKAQSPLIFFERLITILKKSPQARTQCELQFLMEQTKNLKLFQSNSQTQRQDIKSDEHNKQNDQFQKREDNNSLHLNCCKSMKLEHFESGRVVFRIGTIGNKFYIVLRGSLGVYIRLPHKKFIIVKDTEDSYVLEKQKVISSAESKLGSPIEEQDKELVEVKILSDNDSFGELALLNNEPRLATIICKEECYLAVLDKDSFNQILRKKEEERLLEHLVFLNKLPAFHNYHANQLRDIHINSFLIKFTRGEMVYREGQESDCSYIIKSGEFAIVKKISEQNSVNQQIDPDKIKEIELNHNHAERNRQKDMQIVVLSNNEIFGDLEIIENKRREYSIECVSKEGYLILIKKQDMLTRILQEKSTFLYLSQINQQRQSLLDSKIKKIELQMENYEHFLMRSSHAFAKKSKNTSPINSQKRISNVYLDQSTTFKSLLEVNKTDKHKHSFNHFNAVSSTSLKDGSDDLLSQKSNFQKRSSNFENSAHASPKVNSLRRIVITPFQGTKQLHPQSNNNNNSKNNESVESLLSPCTFLNTKEAQPSHQAHKHRNLKTQSSLSSKRKNIGYLGQSSSPSSNFRNTPQNHFQKSFGNTSIGFQNQSQSTMINSNDQEERKSMIMRSPGKRERILLDCMLEKMKGNYHLKRLRKIQDRDNSDSAIRVIKEKKKSIDEKRNSTENNRYSSTIQRIFYALDQLKMKEKETDSNLYNTCPNVSQFSIANTEDDLFTNYHHLKNSGEISYYQSHRDIHKPNQSNVDFLTNLQKKEQSSLLPFQTSHRLVQSHASISIGANSALNDLSTKELFEHSAIPKTIKIFEASQIQVHSNREQNKLNILKNSFPLQKSNKKLSLKIFNPQNSKREQASKEIKIYDESFKMESKSSRKSNSIELIQLPFYRKRVIAIPNSPEKYDIGEGQRKQSPFFIGTPFNPSSSQSIQIKSPSSNITNQFSPQIHRKRISSPCCTEGSISTFFPSEFSCKKQLDHFNPSEQQSDESQKILQQRNNFRLSSYISRK